MNIEQPTEGGSGSGAAIGSIVTGGTDPSVLFIQGGLLAQDPINFRWTPNTAGLFRITSGTESGSVGISPALVRTLTSMLNPIGETLTATASFTGGDFQINHANTDMGSTASLTGNDTSLYGTFNNTLVSYYVYITYNISMGTFTAGNTVINTDESVSGIVLYDDGMGNVVIDSPSPLWLSGEVMQEQLPGTTTTAIVDSVIRSPLQGTFGIFEQPQSAVNKITIENDPVNGVNGAYVQHQDYAVLRTINGSTVAEIGVNTIAPSMNTQVSDGTNVSKFGQTPFDYTFDKQVKLTKTITPAGTTGDQTIDTQTGSVNFAPLDATITVTNSLVTPDSVIVVQVASDDLSLTSVIITQTTGSFTIYPDNLATAETRVNFIIVN